jgi:SsrA-binding protein
MEIKNKKASYDFHFEETEVAGIVLSGSEIKSLREGKASMVDCYVFITDNEMWLRKMYIAPYENGGYANHEPVRDRKLLMTKKQISDWNNSIQTNQSLTIIPVKGFFDKKGVFKLLVALAKGKKLYDKRNSIRERDLYREISKNSKDGRE